MNSRTDGSTADNPVGVAHQGVDTTRYFRVTLVLQNKTHQEFIFILHSDVLGKEMYGVELLSTKVAFYFYIFNERMKYSDFSKPLSVTNF